MEIFLFFVLLWWILPLVGFVYFLFRRRRLFAHYKIFQLALELIVLVLLPLLFLKAMDYGAKLDCCIDSVYFAPNHRWSIYLWVILCLCSYFMARYDRQILPPLLELSINVLLVWGIVLNVLIIVHINNRDIIGVVGNVPIIILFLEALLERQILIIPHFVATPHVPNHWVYRIFSLQPILRYPVLLLLCLPLVLLGSLFLMIFGQKPDAFIRAFTDTYHRGFSMLNAECADAKCGGHFLCSVAAQGHTGVVKPQRLGIRGGKRIICNRQLLIANAFEELLEERMPRLHTFIRRRYNRVGKLVHRYYGIFQNKYVADAVYILMKPAEWLFLLTLYLFDRKPENRIARQYLSPSDREKLQNK